MNRAAPIDTTPPPLLARLARASLVLCALACCLVLAGAPRALAASSQEVAAAQQHAVSYLRSQQLPNGSFGEDFGGEWALSALASAGVAPVTVRQGEAGTDARSYYRKVIADTETWPGTSAVGAFETAALAAFASGIDPARVSPTQNLIAQVIGRRDAADPGYYGEPSNFNDTVFALLALADTPTDKGHQRVPRVLLEEPAAAVRANQHTDGGWTFASASGTELSEPAEVEATGAAMAALCGAGVPSSDPAIVHAREFLVRELNSEPAGTGAFSAFYGANTDTDAWAVEGLNACNISAQSAEFTTSKGKTPIDFLLSQQLSSGAFRYEAEGTEENFYSTQDALRAISGAGFTVHPVKPPKGAWQWVGEKAFTPGRPALLSLIVGAPGHPLESCSLTLTPSAIKSTLAAVLEAARSDAQPSGCVTSFTPASGSGAIKSVNGISASGSTKWMLSSDRSSARPAKRSTTVEIGETLDLQLG